MSDRVEVSLNLFDKLIENYRTWIEECPLGVAVFEGNDFIFCNTSLLNIFKYENLNEFGSKCFQDYIIPDLRDDFLMFLSDEIQNNSSQFIPFKIICKDGEIRDVNIRKLQKLGRNDYTHILFKDVSEFEYQKLKIKVLEFELKKLKTFINKNNGDFEKIQEVIFGESQADRGDLYFLSKRELEICDLIKKGKKSLEIAKRLGVTKKTVDNHRNNIRTKIGLGKKEISLRKYLKTNEI